MPHKPLLAALLLLASSGSAFAEPELSAAPVYRTITRSYDTSSVYTKGLLVSEVVRDGQGNPYVESENTYTLHDVDTNTAPADARSTSRTLFPQLTRTDRRFFEGQAGAGKVTRK